MAASIEPADPQTGEASLVLANADGTEARTLTTV
jgi:hypothetical protein